MKTYSVRIRRHAFVTYWGEVQADSSEQAAKLAQEGWSDDSLEVERDSSQLEEFDEIEPIRPDYDIEEVDG